MQQLLVPGDPPPFSVHNEQGRRRCCLLCDHASKAGARRWRFGISQTSCRPHRLGHRWLDAAIALAGALDAPLVAFGLFAPGDRLQPLAGRRGLDARGQRRHACSANKGLTKEQVDARAEACFWPYHRRG